MINVAAELQIADFLRDGPRDVSELSKRTNANPDSLYRFLRALTNVGILVEHETQPRRFELTALGTLLRSDVKDTMRDAALMTGIKAYRDAWDNLSYSVKTGRGAFDHVNGMSMFEYFQQKDREAGRVFNSYMKGLSAMEAQAVISSGYNFAKFDKIVDVAGGTGMLLSSILTAGGNRKAQGVLYEMPHAAEEAKKYLSSAGLAGRWEVVVGDFFKEVPSGGDAYLLKHIIHDWDDERAATILRNCRRAIKDNGRLLVLDAVVPGPNVQSFSKILDLEMLVVPPNGKERTREEFARLFAQEGFKLTRVIPTDSIVSIIEGVPS
jgi:SAM-dependent methyltransferase